MSAVISACGLYRYKLLRTWSDVETIAWVMLNPSTADATQDDPTIRRCIGFAKQWGYGGIEVYNLFAYRATNPAALKQTTDPVGPENNFHLRHIPQGQAIVAAWGGSGKLLRMIQNRGVEVRALLSHRLQCLGRSTKSGQPNHPLYLAGNTPLEEYA